MTAAPGSVPPAMADGSVGATNVSHGGAPAVAPQSLPGGTNGSLGPTPDVQASSEPITDLAKAPVGIAGAETAASNPAVELSSGAAQTQVDQAVTASDVPAASGGGLDLGGTWADAFSDAPSNTKADAPTARPSQTSSLSELVLDAEFVEDADVSLSPESFDSAPVAAAAVKAPETAADLTGDDLSDDDILEDVDAVSAEPSKAAVAEASDVLEDVDVMSAEPHEEAAAPEATDVLEDVDVMSAEPHETPSIPEAEPVLAAAPEALTPTAESKDAPPPEPISTPAIADAPKSDGLLEAMAFEDLPETPAAVEAAKPERLPPEADQPARPEPVEAPTASVIAAPVTQDAEADALEFSLAGDSPRPSATPAETAESWQVAAAPKADAVAPAPPEETPSPAPTEERRADLPPEFEVALVSSAEPALKPVAEPAPEPDSPSAADAPPTEAAEPAAPPKPRLVAAPPAPVRDRTPIALDDLPTSTEEPMQLASTWEFVGWQGGGEGEGAVGHSPETTWADRVVDLDVPAAAPATSEDGVALASAWEFMQQPWQPQAVANIDPAQALLAAASASTDTPVDGPAVTAEQVLSALDTADSQGMVGKVLLAYSAGRFRRAFLLGDSFGLARVGRAWGPGSDRPEVSALKVDLDTPSLFTSALNGPSPSVFSAPQAPQDEAIFSALCGESEHHLLVFPLHSRGQPVAFFVAEHGPAPVDVAMLEELGRIADRAVEICTRLHRFP